MRGRLPFLAIALLSAQFVAAATVADLVAQQLGGEQGSQSG
jgi:hypothetical protein